MIVSFEAATSMLGLAGALLLAFRERWSRLGWLAFLASNVVGVAFAASAGHHWLLAQQIGFTGTSLLGVWIWIVKPLRAARQGKDQMRQLECNTRPDGVDQLVRDLTPAEITSWLIKHHGLNEGARAIVESNLQEQLRWHRLRGRLDRHPAIAALVELWLRMRGERGRGLSSVTNAKAEVTQ